jgi:hypothetical protein
MGPYAACARVVVVFAAVVAWTAPASAATIVVSGACTLADAIRAANTDTATGGCPAGSGSDVIELTADVTLTTAEEIDGTDDHLFGNNGLPTIRSEVTVNGHGRVIQRDPSYGCPNADPARNFRILELVNAPSVTLNDVAIKNGCETSQRGGGGVSSKASLLAVNRSTFAGNVAKSDPVRIGGVLRDVKLGDGGGILTSTSFGLTITDSTFAGNVANRDGGGVANFSFPFVQDEPQVVIVNSTFIGNSAGAGLNPVGVGGGAVFTINSAVRIVSSTIAGNTAAGASGHGLRVQGPGFASPNGVFELVNTLVDNPGGPNCVATNAGAFASEGHNLASDTTCGLTGAGDQPGVASGLGTFVDDGTPGRGHVPLLEGSAAIGAGDAALCPALDQLGQPRDGMCDIGAVEWRPAAVDSDGDGILDEVDEDPTGPSDRFSDRALGGQTSGQVTVPAGMTVEITDAADGTAGVQIVVTGSPGRVRVRIDGKGSVVRLAAGTYTLTDPDVELTAAVHDAGLAEIDLPDGRTVVVEPGEVAKIIETAAASGAVTAVTVQALLGTLTVDGAEVPQGTTASFSVATLSGVQLAILRVPRQPTLRAFVLTSTFRPSGTSNGIAPLTQAVTFRVGSAVASIPPGSFRRDSRGRFVFLGRIGDVLLTAAIAPLRTGGFRVDAAGTGPILVGAVNPVGVSVTIGDDGAATETVVNSLP